MKSIGEVRLSGRTNTITAVDPSSMYMLLSIRCALVVQHSYGGSALHYALPYPFYRNVVP